MPVRIDRLVCRVTVKQGRKAPLIHAAARPAKPDMAFVEPKAEPVVEGEPPSSEMATEEATFSEKHSPAPGLADTRAVADRVYELMRQDLALARLRGGSGRKG